MPQYFVIYKPFEMLSQFTPHGDTPVLGRLYNFPSDVYPVGRLDADSEGLLILTNDKSLNSKLLSPKNGHKRTYWVQVEGEFSEEALEKIQSPLKIRVNKKDHITLPCEAEILKEEPKLPERNPPIRFRKNVPTTWIQLKLKEGKNRQVRKMTAKVGFPTLRLVRHSIENLDIEGMRSGQVKVLEREEIYKLLKIRSGAVH